MSVASDQPFPFRRDGAAASQTRAWSELRSTARLGRFRLLALLWLLFAATSLVSRAVLSVVALHEGLVTFGLLPQAWLGGMLLDALAGMYFCMPFVAYLWLIPERAHRSRIGRAILRIGFFMASAALLYLIAAEYFFFDEFNARFNYTAVEYLIYPTEVFGNIRDSYPVFSVMAASFVGALLLLFVPSRQLQCIGEQPQSFGQRSAIVGVLAVVVAASLWLVNLETVQGFSSNRIADEIAANRPDPARLVAAELHLVPARSRHPAHESG